MAARQQDSVQNRMNSSKLTRYLILLICAVLIYFGFGTLRNLGQHPGIAGVFIFYAFAMFVEAAVLLFCSSRLEKRSKRIYWLALILLGLNVISIIFDQVGFIDIFFMLLNLATLTILYIFRKEFLPE